jgi:hypothetical protein
MAYATLLAAALLSSVANFAAGQTCVIPTSAQAGYDFTTNQMACSGLTTGAITCETQPTCATGYSGTPDNADMSCGTDGGELTLGGCTGPSVHH